MAHSASRAAEIEARRCRKRRLADQRQRICVDLHASDARKKGETERRLYGVSVWRETPLFHAARAGGLAWTEAITRAPTHAPDADYAALREHFSEGEMVNLTLAIAVINSWNRLSVGFRKMPAA